MLLYFKCFSANQEFNKMFYVESWSEVKCRVGKEENETLWEKFIWVVKWWEVKG